MKSLRYLNKYFFRYKWRLLLGILFVGISNYFGVKGITLTGEALDIVRTYTILPVKTQENQAELMDALLWLFFLIISWALISGIFLFLTRQTIIVLSRLIEYDMKNEIFAHYQQLDTAFYKRNSTGDLMNRISEDVSKVRMYTGPTIMYFIGTFFSFCFTIYEMRATDATLAFFTLLPLPVLAVSIYFISDRIFRKNTQVQEQLSTITSHSQETFSGIRVLKAYGREQQSLNEFDKKSTEYRYRTLQLVKTEALFQPFVAGLIGLSIILTIYIGSIQYFKGLVTLGSIATFLLFINRLTWPIASLGWVTSLIQRAASSQTRINEFLRTQPEIVAKNAPQAPIKGKIEFINVSFTYPDSGIKALDNVSFVIPEGSSLAIVGRTGSGKSTIAALICRLYDVSSGGILIDGKNIREYDLSSLRSITGYVPQDVFLFSDTIAHNIAFSLDETKTDHEKIEEAARDAAIFENIMQFPEKFETLIGERGITLSGGQKQRISIARAIIRQPRILLFDDCLSAVDTGTEEQILNNLKKRMKGKTSIIISHRVSTVKNAGNILVIEQGRIIEQGKHEDLLASGGSYFRLHEMQLLEQQADIQ